MSSIAGNLEARPARTSFEGFRHMVVSLIFITSFFVKIEPALSDVIGLLAILLFFNSGLHFSRYLAAPLLFLIVYLASGLISSIPISMPASHADSQVPYQYTIGLLYTSATGIFLAAYIAADPLPRYLKIEKAYWIGAVLGSILGLLIYFQAGPVFKAINDMGDNSLGDFRFRVRGGYKDPNVFSTWLVFPAISMMQAFIMGRLRIGLISLASFLCILGALFLAFSRGAWIDFVGAAVLTIVLTAMLTPVPSQRTRVFIFSIIGLIFIATVLTLILSIPSVQAAFLDRFTLVKSYDAGETGRFGNQLNSLPMLIVRPLGFGPYQYPEIFNLAPHNTFLNSFASAGWLGGICYIGMFLINIGFGMKAIFTRSPLQPLAIAVFSTLIVMTIQGVQIDNEHWRHIYWLNGMGWALFAVLKEREGRGYSIAEMLTGWRARHT